MCSLPVLYRAQCAPGERTRPEIARRTYHRRPLMEWRLHRLVVYYADPELFTMRSSYMPALHTQPLQHLCYWVKVDTLQTGVIQMAFHSERNQINHYYSYLKPPSQYYQRCAYGRQYLCNAHRHSPQSVPSVPPASQRALLPKYSSQTHYTSRKLSCSRSPS
jgi:hypothetical protein